MGNLAQAIFISGPAGSAKTGFMIKMITRKVFRSECSADEVLILCFSRQKAHEIRTKFKNNGSAKAKNARLNKIRVINLHSLVMRFMREETGYNFGHHNRIAQDVERLLKTKKNAKYPRMDKNLEFEAMINDFGQYLDAHGSSSLRKFRMVAVDELQILNESHLIALLGILKHANFPDMVISGDSNQDIFHWHKKNGSSQDSYVLLQEALAGTYNVTTTQNLNYRRGTTEMANFYQGFENVAESGVTVRPHSKAEQGHKPQIVLIEDQVSQERESHKVIEQIRLGHPDETCMVVARHKWLLEPHVARNVCEAMTIYESLGSEADHVIWLGMSNMDAEAALRPLIRVALTRARKSFTIISTDSAEQVTKWFQNGTYELTDKQQKTGLSQIRKNLKHIHKNRNKSLSKLGYLDSIELSIAHKDTRFAPFLSHNTQTKRKGIVEQEQHWKTLKLSEGTIFKDLPTYSIRRYMLKNGRCSYKFLFFSLAFLSMNRFTEREILQACLNEIIDFFDGRIDPDVIRTSRLDLAAHFICDPEQKNLLRTRLQSAGRSVGRYKKRSVFNISPNEKGTSHLTQDTQTTYVNHGSKAEGITIAAYDPAEKDLKINSKRINIDKNRISNKRLNRDDVFKIEIRSKGLRTVKSWFGSNLLTNLIQKSDKLPGTYKQWAAKLGVLDGTKVLGLNFEQKSRGGFRVLDGTEDGKYINRTAPDETKNEAEISNKINVEPVSLTCSSVKNNSSSLELGYYTLYYRKSASLAPCNVSEIPVVRMISGNYETLSADLPRTASRKYCHLMSFGPDIPLYGPDIYPKIQSLATG